MTTRRHAVHVPQVPSRGKRARTVSVGVTEGIHTGLPAHLLPAGFTPDARNFYPYTDGWIEPRSGLSQHGTYNFNGPVLGAAEVFDTLGNSCGVAPSATSLAFLHPSSGAWSNLSYVPSTITHVRGNLSGTSTDYFRTVSVYDPGTDQFLAVVSNDTSTVKFFSVLSTTTTFSDFSWLDSLASHAKARDLTVVNDRLVFFNLEDSNGTRYPTRVLWSARGDPKNFALASEAGWEDLMSMRGSGQAIVRFRDFSLLFTEYEIWRATPTLDSYAFRFDRVIDNLGCPFPKTIAVTPNGVIFVEHDLEVYITDGSVVVPLGPVGGEGPSRIQRLLRDESVNRERMWAIYNHTDNRYEVYFTASDSVEGYPTRALFYDFTSKSWWPQRFSFGISAAVDLYDYTTFVSYDEVEDTYDSTSLEYDAYDVRQKNRRVNVFTSLGSSLRYRSEATNDAGSLTIDARWKSPGIRSSDHHQMHLSEIWVDYENDSSSSASIFLGDARSDTFGDGKNLNLTSSGAPLHVAAWKTSPAPAFEVRIADGGKPRLTLFVATLKDASKF